MPSMDSHINAKIIRFMRHFVSFMPVSFLFCLFVFKVQKKKRWIQEQNNNTNKVNIQKYNWDQTTCLVATLKTPEPDFSVFVRVKVRVVYSVQWATGEFNGKSRAEPWMKESCDLFSAMLLCGGVLWEMESTHKFSFAFSGGTSWLSSHFYKIIVFYKIL